MLAIGKQTGPKKITGRGNPRKKKKKSKGGGKKITKPKVLRPRNTEGS